MFDDVPKLCRLYSVIGVVDAARSAYIVCLPSLSTQPASQPPRSAGPLETALLELSDKLSHANAAVLPKPFRVQRFPTSSPPSRNHFVSYKLGP